MIIRNFAILASDTARTKAYIQMMRAENLIPEGCIVYSDRIDKMREEADVYVREHIDYDYFNLSEPVLYTIRDMGIECHFVENKDINSDDVTKAINEIHQEYLIYSGYGGYILKPHLFQLGKKYVHVHAGILPGYRGSTTAYYSILQEYKIGATAIFLSEKIDEGEVLTQEVFERIPRDVDIDLLYEPYLRSRVLKTTIQRYIANGELNGVPQEHNGAQTYYIIHPVLKHLALLSRR